MRHNRELRERHGGAGPIRRRELEVRRERQDRYGSQYRRKPVSSPNLTDQADHVTWGPAGRPVLNADDPDVLREANRRACVELLETIGDWARDASPVAVGESSALATAEPARDPVAEP